ncbi:MAG: histidine phosphatase family protein [Chloroflexi bacterium]|nr:histidine phosphatase family protein [Chloroflexota bacterium]
MKTLLVMRHAKSSWAVAEDTADLDRPLTGRGKRDAEAMAAQLVQRGLRPDVLVHSPAKRCRATAKRLVAGWPGPTHVVEDERLYGRGVAGCRDVLAALPDDALLALLIGHNPTFEDLVRFLTGSWVRMATCTVACIDLPIEAWQEMEALPAGTLRSVFGPTGIIATDAGADQC